MNLGVASQGEFSGLDITADAHPKRPQMTSNELALTPAHEPNASPATSHSDSVGPPLSDFAPLEDAQSDWTPSDASSEHEEEESFDMVASRDWSEGSRESEPRSRTSSSGDESRMRLSFPDPISSVGNLTSKHSNSDLGASITDETAYSFLLDTAPAPSFDSPRSVSSSLPSTDDALSSVAESNPPPLLDEHPSTPPESSEPERPQLKDRAISDWLKLTGEARAEKEKVEASKKESVADVHNKEVVSVDDTSLSSTPDVLEVLFVGGSENERQIVLDQLKRLEGIQTDTVTQLQSGSSGLIVNLTDDEHATEDIAAARSAFEDDSRPRFLNIVVPCDSSDDSPLTSTQSSLASLTSFASTDSSRTIRGAASVRSSSIILPRPHKPETARQENGGASKVFRLEDLVAADNQTLSDALKESLFPLGSGDEITTIEEHKDDPITSFKKSMVSRTLLLLTAALAIAAASVLETSPSFGALRPVNQVAPAQHSVASSSSAARSATSTTQPIATTSTRPSPVQSLPPPETPALIDPPPPTNACSIGHPGACALAVFEAQNSLALLATKLASAPSLFGAPNASAKVADESEQTEQAEAEERKKARTRRIIERKVQRMALRPRRSTSKPKRKSLHFCSSASSTPPTAATVPSFREALHIVTHSAHHQAQQLTHRISTTHLPRAQRHIHRASSSVRILSHRAELHLRHRARTAIHQQTILLQHAQRHLDAAAPKMDAFARRGEQKLKEIVRSGDEGIRSFAKLSDHHLHAATTRATRHLSAVAQLAQERHIPRRLRDSSAKLAGGALRFGKQHLIRAAEAVEAIQNGEVGVLGGVKGCGTLEGGVRERCEKRKLRERERRRKERLEQGEGEFLVDVASHRASLLTLLPIHSRRAQRRGREMVVMTTATTRISGSLSL